MTRPGGQPPDPREDPGLARERTALAWSRSALALAATGAALVRAGAADGSLALGLAVGVPLVVLAAAIGIAEEVAYRRLAAGRAPPGPLAGLLSFRTLTVVTVAAGLASMAMIVLT
jgi:uncharacterized membrane protein YidH (DUF202 family)